MSHFCVTLHVTLRAGGRGSRVSALSDAPQLADSIDKVVGPIDKVAQEAILRRLGWVSGSEVHFQNFEFIATFRLPLYYDLPFSVYGRPTVDICHA